MPVGPSSEGAAARCRTSSDVASDAQEGRPPWKGSLAASARLPRGARAARMENHHQLPRQFEDWFNRVGLKIEDFVIRIGRKAHRMKPNGLHVGKGEANWNGAWEAFVRRVPDATKRQILNQLARMRGIFGLGG